MSTLPARSYPSNSCVWPQRRRVWWQSMGPPSHPASASARLDSHECQRSSGQGILHFNIPHHTFTRISTRGWWPYRPAVTRAMRNKHVIHYDFMKSGDRPLEVPLCTRGLLLKRPFWVFLSYYTSYIQAIGLIWKAYISSSNACMVAWYLTNSDWVTDQNVKRVWSTPARLRRPK